MRVEQRDRDILHRPLTEADLKEVFPQQTEAEIVDQEIRFLEQWASEGKLIGESLIASLNHMLDHYPNMDAEAIDRLENLCRNWQGHVVDAALAAKFEEYKRKRAENAE